MCGESYELILITCNHDDGAMVEFIFFLFFNRFFNVFFFLKFRFVDFGIPIICEMKRSVILWKANGRCLLRFDRKNTIKLINTYICVSMNVETTGYANFLKK